MSEVIKSGNAFALARVKRLPIPAKGGQATENETDRLTHRIAALEDELRRRDATIAHLHTDIEEALARGKSEGRALGLAEADERQAERLGLLEQGLQRAQDELAASLGALERLAALLARDCLDILFADPLYRNELVAGLIAAQMARIEKSALLGIVLSPKDFADTSALAQIARRAGVAAARFSLDAELPSGGCVMRLKLGEHEVGIGQQWGALRDHLDELSLPEDAA